MKQPHPHQDFTVVVATDYDADGYPETQVAPIGDGGSNIPAEARWIFGFIARANDADQDSSGNVTNGAFAKTEKEGSTLHSYTLDDPRVTALLPKLSKGGSQTYGGKPNDATTISYAQHDGSGNYKVEVPAGKSITIDIVGGPSIVISGTTVVVGGTGAQAVTFGSATIQLQTILTTFWGSMEADPLLPILLPATYSAVQLAVTQLAALVLSFPATGQSQVGLLK